MRVAGVDGCRGGWLVAEVTTTVRWSPSALRVRVDEDLVTLVAGLRRGEVVAAGLDMPIGLPEAGPRAADLEARRRLGPRAASLFPTPPRAVLAATDFDDALARCRAVDGRGLSRQTYNLLARMRQVAAVVTPDLQPAISEVHPETTFTALGPGPCRHAKRTPAGRAERRARLDPWYGDTTTVIADRPAGAAPDDVLDALAAAWTAWRIATGRAEWLGDPDARDPAGLRLQIAV